ncbi:MAG: hypothetical protein HY590_01510 [Candidatus Omnitrophica bacterium]|nr:hypothetical protein [Candidatus Omnitrophota bacterium]
MNFRKWFTTRLLIILTLSSASSTGILFMLKEREVTRRLAAEEALLRALRSKTVLEEALSSHKNRSARMEHDLLGLKQTNQMTLVRLKGVEKRLTRLQHEITKERLEKQKLAKERNTLHNQLMITQGEKKSLRTQMTKILARSPEEVDLGQIIVSATPILEGKVLVVNEKFQFVVVDLGSEAKLDAGTVLTIYREDQYIGRVQVEEVRDTISACRILPEWTQQPIQENDHVREL